MSEKVRLRAPGAGRPSKAGTRKNYLISDETLERIRFIMEQEKLKNPQARITETDIVERAIMAYKPE